MKTRHLQANPRFYIIFPYICYQTLRESCSVLISFLLAIRGPKSLRIANLYTKFSISGVSWRSPGTGRIATYWAELMRRVLAPLRRIVSRELEVYVASRVRSYPASFVVHDKLECGHTFTNLNWDIFDLVNAYTESPWVKAVRHRCHECLTLTAKKPVQSVTTVKTAVA